MTDVRDTLGAVLRRRYWSDLEVEEILDDVMPAVEVFVREHPSEPLTVPGYGVIR